MDICHQHNLVDPATAGRQRNFGIRVTLPAGDTLRKVLGDDWEKFHWYATEGDRHSNADTRKSYQVVEVSVAACR